MSRAPVFSSRRWAPVRALVLTLGTTSALGGLAIACDEVYADPVTTAPPNPFAPPDSGGLRVSRTPPIQCPRSEVRVNSACSQAGGRCEYGTSPDEQCNAMYACTSDTYGTYWIEKSSSKCTLSCPEDPTLIVDGAPCDVSDAGGDEAELHCTVPQGTCVCTTGRDGSHAHSRKWVCTRPDNGCPLTRPGFGQPCFGDHACDYGSCISKRGMRMVCLDDVWQTESAPCPE